MHLRGRAARDADFVEAQALIPDRFLYESADMPALFELWRRIVDDESGYASVVVGQAPRPIDAFGISVALKPDFVENLFARPQPFLAARILHASKAGDSPIMTREEVAAANSAWGVDVFVLHHGYALASDDPDYYGVVMALAAEFVRRHAGLNLRSLTQEFYDRAWLDMAARHGFNIRHDFGRTFFAGIRRSEVLSPDRGDFVTNSLFARFPAPALALDPSERKLLRAALEDESDAAVDSDERLDGFFERIARIDESFARTDGEPGRRRRVFAWFRSHPEELHPYAMQGATP